MVKRLAILDDIPVLVELRKKLLVESGEPLPVTDVDEHFTEYFTEALADGSFVSWVMEVGGEIVAASGICFYPLPPTFYNTTGRIAYITNMYTKSEYRQKGLATELLHTLIDEAKKRGIKIIRLHAYENRKPMYKKAGFTDSDGYMALKL